MKTKRIVSLILAAALMMCGVQTAFAKETTDISAQAQQLVSLYLESSPKAAAVSSASSAVLYEKIPAYNFNDGNFEPLDTTDYYPVSIDGDVIGIFIIGRDGSGSEVYSFSSEFAEELTDFSDKSDQVCIVFDGLKMYLMGPSENQKVYDTHGDAPVLDAEVAVLNAVSLEDMEIDAQDFDFYNTKEQNEIATLDLQNRKARATGRTQVNLELWNQNSSSSTDNLCWAGTVWSIGYYLTGNSSWTPVKIAQDYFGSTNYNQGLAITQIPSIYSTYYKITGKRMGGQISYSSITSNINNDTPIHTSWECTTTPSGYTAPPRHSMGLVGYGNNEEICVNDTNIGDYKWIQKSSGVWYYTYGSLKYTWDDTITF